MCSGVDDDLILSVHKYGGLRGFPRSFSQPTRACGLTKKLQSCRLCTCSELSFQLVGVCGGCLSRDNHTKMFFCHLMATSLFPVRRPGEARVHGRPVHFP